MLFKRGSKAPNGANGKPSTGAVPEGGYGSGGVPGKAQKTSTPKNAPAGKHGSYGTPRGSKPSGKYGTYGKPNAGTVPKGGTGSGTGKVRMGSYANDGMAEPKTPIPSDQKTGRFNLPRGKFTY
jgi:hypothetical protein